MGSPLVAGYRGVVCDLDGVVYRGPTAVPYAADSLAALAVPILYATNNASRTPHQVRRHLQELGLRCDADQVVTSPQAAVLLLRDRVPDGSVVLVVGGEGVVAALAEGGYDVVRSAAQPPGPVAAVVQGYGASVCAGDLAEAAYAIAQGALWIATNTDATLPTDRGIAPGNGTLVAAVETATGREPWVAGKPERHLYDVCASRLGLPVSSLLAVGDRLSTDIAGANAAGCDSLLVLTGVDDVVAAATAAPALRPRLIAPDLRALNLPYPQVRHDESWFVCGAARVRLDGPRWATGSSDVNGMSAVRAALAAVHHAIDTAALSTSDAARLLREVPGTY